MDILIILSIFFVIVFVSKALCLFYMAYTGILKDIFFWIITLVFGTLKKGDYLNITDEKTKSNISGYIEKITPSVTILLDEFNTRTVVSNSKIYENIIRNEGNNETEIQVNIQFELRHIKDVERAKKIIQSETERIFGDSFNERRVDVKISKLKPDGAELKLYYCRKVGEHFLARELRDAIYQRFIKEDIVIGVLPNPKDGYI